jgi:hypothetical protein
MRGTATNPCPILSRDGGLEETSHKHQIFFSTSWALLAEDQAVNDIQCALRSAAAHESPKKQG